MAELNDIETSSCQNPDNSAPQQEEQAFKISVQIGKKPTLIDPNEEVEPDVAHEAKKQELPREEQSKCTSGEVEQESANEVVEHDCEEEMLEQLKRATEEIARRKELSRSIVDQIDAAVEEWKADFARSLEEMSHILPFDKN